MLCMCVVCSVFVSSCMVGVLLSWVVLSVWGVVGGVLVCVGDDCGCSGVLEEGKCM